MCQGMGDQFPLCRAGGLQRLGEGREDMKQIGSGEAERGKVILGSPGSRSQNKNPSTSGYLEGDPRKHGQEGWGGRQGGQAVD